MENDILFENIFKYFSDLYPDVAKHVLSYVNAPYTHEVIFTLDDGERVLYCLTTNALRTLRDPKDIYALSDEEWCHEFAKKVRWILYGEGLNQVVLSERSGIPQTTISKYLAGRTMPSHRNFRRIAKALGVPPEELEKFD